MCEGAPGATIKNQDVAWIATGADSFELKLGQLVQAENTCGDFVRIHAADRRSGWVSDRRGREDHPILLPLGEIADLSEPGRCAI
jgi:hypothetical protein